MASVAPQGHRPIGEARDTCISDGEQRLDPGLGRFTSCVAPPGNAHWSLVVGLPVGFTFALGLLLLAFGGAHLVEAVVFLAAGGVGLICVRYLDRHS